MYDSRQKKNIDVIIVNICTHYKFIPLQK